MLGIVGVGANVGLIEGLLEGLSEVGLLVEGAEKGLSEGGELDKEGGSVTRNSETSFRRAMSSVWP